MKIRTILVIDDNETDQFLFNISIRKLGNDIDMLSAYDGSEAIKIIESKIGSIDLIFLDLNMPGMNGFEFLEKYENISNNTAKVFVISSSINAEDERKVRSYSCVSNYLNKPINYEKLQKIVLREEDLIK